MSQNHPSLRSYRRKFPKLRSLETIKHNDYSTPTKTWSGWKFQKFLESSTFILRCAAFYIFSISECCAKNVDGAENFFKRESKVIKHIFLLIFVISHPEKTWPPGCRYLDFPILQPTLFKIGYFLGFLQTSFIICISL